MNVLTMEREGFLTQDAPWAVNSAVLYSCPAKNSRKCPLDQHQALGKKLAKLSLP